MAEGFELIVGDISDAAKLNSVLQRVDAVMYFAAHTYVSESVSNRKYFQNNVADGLSLLHAVIDSGARKFIFYRPVQPMEYLNSITEKAPRLPINGATKLSFENALEACGQAYGLRFVSFRYFNASGADESGEIGEVHVPETHLIPSDYMRIIGGGCEASTAGVYCGDGASWLSVSFVHCYETGIHVVASISA